MALVAHILPGIFHFAVLMKLNIWAGEPLEFLGAAKTNFIFAEVFYPVT